MSYTIQTHQGEAAVFSISSKYNLGGYTFALQVANDESFTTTTNIGSFAMLEGNLIVTLTAAEVDANQDKFFRIRATPPTGSAFYLAGGNLEYIPAAFEQVPDGEIDENGYLRELSTGAEDHTHGSTDITNSSPLGRNILVAATPADVRALIGAGTSSLQLGTTATTAKQGNYQPTAEQISNATTIGRNMLKASSAAVAQSSLGIVPATTNLPGLLQIGGDLTGDAVNQFVSGISLAKYAYRPAMFATDADIYGDMIDGPQITVQMPRAGRMLVLFGADCRQPDQGLAVQHRGLCVAIRGDSSTGVFAEPSLNELHYNGTGWQESVYGFRFLEVPSGPITLYMLYRNLVYTGKQGEFRNRWIAGIPC